MRCCGAGHEGDRRVARAGVLPCFDRGILSTTYTSTGEAVAWRLWEPEERLLRPRLHTASLGQGARIAFGGELTPPGHEEVGFVAVVDLLIRARRP